MILSSIAPFSLNLFADLAEMLHYDFMRHAFLAGGMLAIVAGLVGYFVVTRHQAFAGEALSDVAFTGALVGALLGGNILIGLFGTTVAVALGMGMLGERASGRDVAIGTMLAWVLGLGVLCLSIVTTQGNSDGTVGVSILFGSLLGITTQQLLILLLVGGGAGISILVMARPLLFASLDPNVAAARGVPVRALGLAFLALVAITVSEATPAVGALLLFALLVLPAASAQALTIRPYHAMALAAALALSITWLGTAIGFYLSLPISVLISFLAFIVYLSARAWRTRQQGQRTRVA